MSDTLTYARSTADEPRQYTPHSYSHPNRAVAFDWQLAPVEAGSSPVVTLSVSHHASSKAFRVELYTSVDDGRSRLTRFSFGGDEWADRRISLDRIPVARFSRKKLEEAAEFWLNEVQANPESFAQLFETDESAVRS